jgi:hypothetical protein
MRLAEFILANIEPILVEWENFARSLLPGGKMTVVQLRDDAESILLATARDMQNLQTLQQQESKSRGAGGAGGAESDRLDIASDMHGADRVAWGFHITEVVSEYRALRATVLRLWRNSNPSPDQNDIDDVTRFNEALDQSLARGVASYSRRIDDSRQMFLAILGHDLRNPLNTIRTAAYLIAMKDADRRTADAVSLINTSADAMAGLINDLIDFSSSALGHAMPLHREPTNMRTLCQEVIQSCRATYPHRVLRFHCEGEVDGVWDVGRIRQVVSNLLGNAIQHGSPDGPIDVSVATARSRFDHSRDAIPAVVLSVRNEGPPIPPELLPTLFDPLKRYETREAASQRTPGSVGLGLYIVREIAMAEGGTVSVTSTAETGTTFTVCIPRFLDAADHDEPDRTIRTASSERMS